MCHRTSATVGDEEQKKVNYLQGCPCLFSSIVFMSYGRKSQKLQPKCISISYKFPHLRNLLRFRKYNNLFLVAILTYIKVIAAPTNEDKYAEGASLRVVNH